MELTKDILFEEFITNNLSAAKIGEKYGYRNTQIYGMLEKYEIRKSENIESNVDKLTYDVLYEEYVINNLSMKDISDKYKVGKTTVQRLLKSNNIEKDKSVISKQMMDKLKQTNLEKYGVEYASQNKEIINKMKKTNIDRYGNACSLNNKNVHEKMINNNIKKYGVAFPAQHKISYDYFSDKDSARSFLLNKYNGNKITISELSNDLNISRSRLEVYAKRYELEDLISYRPMSSSYEDDIVNSIMSFYSDEIIRNSRILDKKEVDIYLPDYNLGIEFNGSYWHCEENKDKHYHINKSKIAFDNGIFIYHIFEYEWCDEDRRNKILNQLKNLLSCNENKIYARKCEIKNVDIKNKKKFLNENHIQGNDSSSIILGLYYNDELVSIMTFTKPRFNKQCRWELSRYCSKAGTNVIGGASKLFKHFINNYADINDSIVSYSDIAKTKGGLYEALGFTYSHTSEPNYIWWRTNDDIKTRYQTQMKDEVKVMQEQGYYRIYDCGNKVWIYKKSKSD